MYIPKNWKIVKIIQFINSNLKVKSYLIKTGTQGDSLFSSVGELPKSKSGEAEINLASQINRIQRYNLSKSFISEAELLERTWIVNFTNRVLRHLNRYKNNYVFKGLLLYGLIHNAVKG